VVTRGASFGAREGTVFERSLASTAAAGSAVPCPLDGRAPAGLAVKGGRAAGTVGAELLAVPMMGADASGPAARAAGGAQSESPDASEQNDLRRGDHIQQRRHHG
jgi:hypothetical protein